MSKKSKQIALIIALNLLLIGIIAYSTFWRSISMDQYNSIKAGTSQNEIEKALGQPLSVSHLSGCFGEAIVWHYNLKTSLMQARIVFLPDAAGTLIVDSKSKGWEAIPHPHTATPRP